MRGHFSIQNIQTASLPKTNENLKALCWLFLLSALLIFQVNLSAQCPGGSGVIGGRVVGDYNFNGADDQVGGVRDVKVNLYSCNSDGSSVLVESTVSNYNGDYYFSNLTDGTDYKVEFETPVGYSPGFGGNDFGSGIQFSKSPNCAINTAFAAAEDFYEDDPEMLSTCFINGNPSAPNFNGSGMEVLVGFPFSNTGQAPLPSKYGTAGEYGSVYGIGYDRFDQLIFTSAFLKRHVGMGQEGLGGIYVLDASGATPTQMLSFSLSDLGINVGTIPSNSARGLAVATNEPSNDPDAFAKVGKVGMGAIEVDYAGEYLYVINLFEKKLHKIDIRNLPTPPTAANVTSFNLPSGICTGGEYRPFAVKAYRGGIYVGGVCDASNSQQASDLSASIHKLNGSTFEEIASFPIDYTKGLVTMHADCENYPGWYPWTDDFPESCDGGSTIVYPQPILSGIEFDTDGSMILGFMDKLGHQLGFKNYPLVGDTPLITNVSGGDLIRVNRNDDGSFSLENNGTAGAITTSGANNGEGPGGGEFYNRDVFEGGLNNIVPPAHSETSQGGIAFYRGSGYIATTALDPYSIAYNTGGINWMDNRTGAIRDDEGYQLYRTSSSNIATFAKANGLGELYVTPGLAPLQIGGSVWIDTNNDGVQDGCESFLNGVQVSLLDENGNLVATATTDFNGEYYFQNDDLDRNTKYFIVFGTDGGYDPTTRKLNDQYFTTTNDSGDDFNDSDIQSGNATMAGGMISGMPFIMVTTGDYGFVNHSYDAGFTKTNLNPTAMIGGVAWVDSNGDGIQDANEDPKSGITVQLIDSDGNIIGTTTTDADGSYVFTNVSPGDYTVVFGDLTGHTRSPQNQGDGTDDSDADPNSGVVIISFDPENDGDNLEIDAGFVPDREFIGGLVFKDCNQNGIYDTGEDGVEGIKIILVGNGREVFSDANGNYQFDGLLPGDYTLQFEIPAGRSGLIFSDKDQGGNDDLDSDADPINGTTDVYTLVLGSGIENIYAGIQDVEAPVLQNIPTDITVDLVNGGVIPGVPTNVSATDNYDLNVSIDFDFEEIPSICGYEIIRTWTATDECGNSSTAIQTITVDEGCVCPGTEIIDVRVVNACANIGGTATILTNGDFSEYDFVWIPNRGTQDATNPDRRTDLPVGVYLIILEHKVLDGCNNKAYIQITDDCSSAPLPDSLSFFLKAGETLEYCDDSGDLSGDVFQNKIRCLSGCDVLEMSAQEGSECLETSAKRAGKAVVEFTVTDALGASSATVLTIEVENQSSQAVPIAKLDYFTVEKGKAITFDVCANDILNGNVNRISIIHEPAKGIVRVDPDFNLTYFSDSDQCAEETFAYEICNDAGCDQSAVTIKVRCHGVNPPSGFSPNGDGINDFFVIENIDQYENELQIYNRWGNVVFQQKQYQNDWSGDFSGTHLPAGTYFYVLKYDGGESLSGYLVIQR